MPIIAPSIQWPSVLDEMGPDEDTSILLIGHASISGVEFVVTAVRMQEGSREPDYREAVAIAKYESLDSKIGDIEDLAESWTLETIPINDAQYLVWMVPVAKS
jgi:hypothetical protein